MATFNPPVVPAFLAGTGPAATDLDTLVYQTMSFLQNRVVLRVSQTTTATTLPSSGATTQIVFDNVLEDPYSGWNAAATFTQFLYSGTGATFTWPAGLTGNPSAECWAGGNNGGTGSGVSGAGGGGGGGGEYAAESSLAVGATSLYTVGGAGANTTFAGTSVTVTANHGTNGGNASGSTPGAAGSGGTGSANATHFDGARGGAGGAGGGGGGGSSAGPTSAGHHGNAGAPLAGGAGGAAPPQGGSGGQGGNNILHSSQANGVNGSRPGGGGGGEAAVGSSAGAGAPGQIRLTYTTTGAGVWVCPAGFSGWYQVTLTVRTAAAAAAVDLRPAIIAAGTTYNLNNVQAATSGNPGACATWTVYLVGGQDSVAGAAQILNSAGNINTSLTAGQQSTMEITWITQN